MPLLAFDFNRGVDVGLDSSDKNERRALRESAGPSRLSRPSAAAEVPCSVMGDRAGVGSWSGGAGAASGSSSASCFILKGPFSLDRGSGHQCLRMTREAQAIDYLRVCAAFGLKPIPNADGIQLLLLCLFCPSSSLPPVTFSSNAQSCRATKVSLCDHRPPPSKADTSQSSTISRRRRRTSPHLAALTCPPFSAPSTSSIPAAPVIPTTRIRYRCRAMSRPLSAISQMLSP